MHTTNEFVTAAVNVNHAEGVATWCYFDEFHILLRDPLTASYFVAVWKMLRKKGCVPSALTQNVKDLLASRAAKYSCSFFCISTMTCLPSFVMQ